MEVLAPRLRPVLHAAVVVVLATAVLGLPMVVEELRARAAANAPKSTCSSAGAIAGTGSSGDPLHVVNSIALAPEHPGRRWADGWCREGDRVGTVKRSGDVVCCGGAR